MPRERKSVEKFNFEEMGGRNPTPPPPKKSKPSYQYEPINPDGSSASFKTGGFMPVLAPPSPISGDLEMEVADPDVNGIRCEACVHIAITEVDVSTQTDPLVFPFENQLVVLPPFVFPRGIKWWR